MQEQFEKVKEFHEVFDLPVLYEPDVPDNRVELRINLIEEEVKELAEALRGGNLDEVLKEFCDVAYVLAGAALEFGLTGVFEEAFEEVHRSNMSKVIATEEEADREAVTWAMGHLGEVVDIVPIYVKDRRRGFVLKRQRDGKVVKPSRYSRADMGPILWPGGCRAMD